MALFVDPRDESLWPTADPAGSAFTSILAVVLSPGPTAAEAEISDIPQGAKAAAVITPKGHNAEFAIPLSLLDAGAGKPWQKLRINIRQHDLDTADWSWAHIYWRPRWQGPENCAGSGAFLKE